MKSPAQISDIDVRAYFATPVVFAELENPEQLNLELRDTILSRRSEKTTVSNPAQNYWQSDWDFVSWGGEASRRLLETFAAIGNNMTQIRPDDSGSQTREIPWSLNARAVVNSSGENDLLHAHPNCFWSGVYYVDDGGIADDPSLAGELELFDPRGSAPVMYNSTYRMNVPDGESAGGFHRIRPQNGLMIVFPSWLLHGVSLYRGTGTRISIAINLFISR
jgi:uncharacterized protein (TIGR02466 family)